MISIRVHNAEMVRNLDLTLIRTFLAVAERGNMTAAGNALHLTQSAVSQQIARLEQALEHELFLRDRRSLRLTTAGERLQGKARRLLSLNDEIWADMTTPRVEGPVRLGVPFDLAGPLIAPALKGFADAFPQVEISLLCAASPDLTHALAKGEIDLALVETPLGVSEGECLAVDRLVWVGARGGVAHLKTPLPVSMVAETCAFRPAVLAALRGQSREWRTVFENGSIDATTATVATDLAVTAWLAFTVPSHLDILPAEADLPPLPSFAINLHLPARDAAPATLELARHIREGLSRTRLAA